MAENQAHGEAPPASSEDHTENYVAYLAGGLFTQYDLAANVRLKESVWRLSKGKFELDLPQSKELRQLEHEDLAAYIRNADLLRLVEADILVARFDGQELDTGALVEFMIAKMLGKPAVILRSDSRHSNSNGLDEPYNLMVKNWPRTIELQVDSFGDYLQMIAESRETTRDIDSSQLLLEAELSAAQKGFDNMATRLIEALNAVLKMNSPYPGDIRELVYEAVRYTPGAGFDQVLSEDRLSETLTKLKGNNTF